MFSWPVLYAYQCFILPLKLFNNNNDILDIQPLKREIFYFNEHNCKLKIKIKLKKLIRTNIVGNVLELLSPKFHTNIISTLNS